MSDHGRLFDVDVLTESGPARSAESERGRGRSPGAVGGRVVRVLPDVSGIDKEFDYVVPPGDAAGGPPATVGSVVRVDLNGRRVDGWITGIDHDPPPGVALRPVRAVVSFGPGPDTMALARWTAHRWAGRLSAVLRSATPPRRIRTLPAPSRAELETGSWIIDCERPDTAAAVVTAGPVVVERLPPAGDAVGERVRAIARQAGSSGSRSVLVICPRLGQARYLGGQLRRAGLAVRHHPRDWAAAAGRGGVVVGARSAVWAEVPGLAAVVVVDEHDEAHQEERNPTWHARDVAIERARRAGVPCHLLSPVPSLTARKVADRTIEPSRSDERAGWPLVEIVDRRNEDPVRAGLFSPRVVDAVRSEGRVLCLLNRKGRSVLSACRMCGELVRTEDGERLMVERDGRLVSPATGETRPLVCAHCGATALKRLRLGVTRAAEELAALVAEPVDELSGSPAERGGRSGRSPSRVVVGTEAALHGLVEVDTVVFLDVDAELLAPRYRAAEQAFQLLVLAARLVGSRSGGGRLVIQTRNPDHRVLAAVLRADPTRFSTAEAELRQASGLPPFGALAELSGAGAPELAAAVGAAGSPGVTVLGPNDGRFLVRTDTAEHLAEVLAATDRPAARVRVAVDPPRV